MHTFRVWAPSPKTVTLQLGAHPIAMVPGAGGWWTVEAASAKPGDEYGFLVDGSGPFPDPRSPAQPNGVHGFSRLVDQGDFRWTDSGWQPPPLSAAVVYELHIGTFTPEGTFASAIEKLDHLATLGVTHVELMPVNEFSGQHGWGYDGVDLFAPHHAYGTPAELKKLVNACHTRRLAVILDVVYNHLGPSGNYLAKFAPYFSQKFHTFWGDGINFDGPESDEVRRFFCDNALMWLRDYHFDGLRLDAVHGILDTSATHFLEQLKIEVEMLSSQLGRRLVLIPESDLNDPRLLWPRERGGYQLDAQWSDDFHHALHAILTGEKNGYYEDFGALADLAKALANVFVYDGNFSKHRRRRHGRSPAGLAGHHFLAYLQNHDQVGNRAQGERSSALMSVGKLKIGAALVFTSPFVPLLFQGEEWGASAPFLFFTDHQEPALAQAVRAGRCQEFMAFGWKPEEVPDPQARETFEQSKLNWNELTVPPHTDLLDWHKKLIQLRRHEISLADGRIDRVCARLDEAEGWLVVKRGALTVACNFTTRPQAIPIGPRSERIMLASDAGVKLADGNLQMPPDAAAILKWAE